jgi:hypothetical protein
VTLDPGERYNLYWRLDNISAPMAGDLREVIDKFARKRRETRTFYQAVRENYMYSRGGDKFFKTLAKLASSSVFSLANSENNWLKNIARLASGFVFLLANPEFYSHLASWRVVIRTPVQ